MGGMERPLRVARRMRALRGSLRVGETSRTKELYAAVASGEDEDNVEEEVEESNPSKVP